MDCATFEAQALSSESPPLCAVYPMWLRLLQCTALGPSWQMDFMVAHGVVALPSPLLTSRCLAMALTGLHCHPASNHPMRSLVF